MSWPRRTPSGLLLLASIALAAACAVGSEDGEATRAGAPLPTARPAASGAVHEGPRTSRCSSCHAPADRAHPQWKATAQRFGHDVDRLMNERTSCKCCHLGPIQGFGEPLDRACLSCHDDVKVTIPAMGAQHCVACHTLGTDEPADLKQGAWECQKCHADAHGDRSAIVVHGEVACAECHQPHAVPWTMPRTCTDCHASEATRHGAAPHGEGTQACDDCHQPHERAGAASARCGGCHENQRSALLARTAGSGHERCASCHAPHDFSREGATKCATCHADVKTMAGRGAAQHAECRSCHDPHAAGRPTASTCSSCHSSLRPTHPDPKGTGCIGCHDPHPRQAGARPSIACSQCHTTAKSDTAFHAAKVACTGCHAQHDFKPKDCAGCHASELAASRRSRGHGDCKSCHTAHAPGATPTCGSCHATQVSTAPRGHTECKSCHDTHSGTRQPGAQTCAQCHASKATGAHGGRVDCGSCHRAHGPAGPAAPPACGTCHATPKLGGMHAVKDHQRCADCHAAHSRPRSDRATCIACHAAEKDHEPTAKVCSGCHGFVR